MTYFLQDNVGNTRGCHNKCDVINDVTKVAQKLYRDVISGDQNLARLGETTTPYIKESES